MKNQKLSNFFRLIQLDDGITYALYNSLRLRVIFIDSSFVPFISELQNGKNAEEAISNIHPNSKTEFTELVSAMKNEGFFDDDGDQNKLLSLKRETEHLPVSIMYLIVTRNCNLLCDYCYLAKALCPKKNADMTTEVAQSAIDAFARIIESQGIEKAQIIFYGGEPMANPKVVEFALEYATKKIPGIEFIMNTNGTLTSPKIATLLARYSVNVAVSIDGDKKTHDTHRIDRGGSGTFDRAISGFRTLRENGVDAGISCTITPENVGHLTEVTKWLISDLNVHTMGFNLLMGNCRKTSDLSLYEVESAQALIDCFKITREAGVYSSLKTK